MAHNYLQSFQENEVCSSFQIWRTNQATGDHLEKRHEVKYAYPTFQKSIDILGFEHKTSLKEGLNVMWEWAKNQPKREQFIWPKYELEKGIYSYWKN